VFFSKQAKNFFVLSLLFLSFLFALLLSRISDTSKGPGKLAFPA